MKYEGSCHCGQIAFEAEGEMGSVIECNCSHCGRKGLLLWFIPRDKLKLKTPESGMSTYLFNKKVIQHKFCPVCGVQPLAFAKDKNGADTAAINVRTLKGLDLTALKRTAFDGASR
jgi:hypothetical protein